MQASPPQPTKDQLPRVSRGRVFQSCATVRLQRHLPSPASVCVGAAIVGLRGVKNQEFKPLIHAGPAWWCKISGAIFVVGLLLRQAAPYISSVLGADPAAVKSLLAGKLASETNEMSEMSFGCCCCFGPINRQPGHRHTRSKILCPIKLQALYQTYQLFNSDKNPRLPPPKVSGSPQALSCRTRGIWPSWRPRRRR